MLEEIARRTIRAEVAARGWSLADVVAALARVGHTTTQTTVWRFLDESKKEDVKPRRIRLDEFATWAAALSVPPLDLLAPTEGDDAQNDQATPLRDWWTGREPGMTASDPDAFRARALRTSAPASNFAVMLRALAHEYDAADDAGRQQIALTVADTATGTLRALLRQEKRTTSTARVDREREG